jgi:chitinase
MRRRLLLLTAALVATLHAHAAGDKPAPLFGAGFRSFDARSGKVVAVYVPNWQPASLLDSIKPGSVTHALYAFLRICGPGQLPKDAQACKGKADFELATSPTERDFDAAFARLKQRMPGLKVLASVGGWGGSDPFFHLANDAARRAVFAASAARFLREHSAFDGIDIDWEHPTNNGAANGVQLGTPADGRGYADLMLALRRGFDGRPWLLTSAVNTSGDLVGKIDFRNAAPALDLVLAMSYDFYGPWSATAGHHSALRASREDADDGLTSAARTLANAGVPRSKLVAGVAMYGRGFTGVAGDGPSFNGAARSGSFPPPEGAMAYRDIAEQCLDREGRGRNGWRSVFDAQTQSWALWHRDEQRVLGYDDPRAVIAKGRYAVDQGLAGVFAWELSQDNGDLLNAMNLGVGNTMEPDRP